MQNLEAKGIPFYRQKILTQNHTVKKIVAIRPLTKGESSNQLHHWTDDQRKPTKKEMQDYDIRKNNLNIYRNQTISRSFYAEKGPRRIGILQI